VHRAFVWDAVPHLLATVLAMGGPRTQTIVTNEFRSQARLHDWSLCVVGIAEVCSHLLLPARCVIAWVVGV
jgi:hypothetical protein